MKKIFLINLGFIFCINILNAQNIFNPYDEVLGKLTDFIKKNEPQLITNDTIFVSFDSKKLERNGPFKYNDIILMPTSIDTIKKTTYLFDIGSLELNNNNIGLGIDIMKCLYIDGDILMEDDSYIMINWMFDNANNKFTMSKILLSKL